MADADKDLKLKVTTQGDPSGAEKVGGAINDLSAKTKKYIEDIGAGAEEVNKLELKHRELREIINHLSNEMPELGLVARYALSPWVASLGVALYGISQIMEAHKKMAEMFAEKVDISGMRDLINAIGTNGMVGALNEAAASAETFLHELDHIATAQTTIEEKTNAVVEALKKQSELKGKERGAEEKLHSAQIAADLAAGKITPAQAAVAQAANHDKYSQGANAEANALEVATIAKKKEELEQLTKTVNDGRADVPVREAAAAAAKAKADADKAAVEEWDKKVKEQGDFMTKFAGTPGYDSDIETAKYNQLLEAREQASGHAADSKGAADRAAKDFGTFQENLTKAAEALRKLPEEIARLEKDHAANAGSRRTTTGIEHQTSQTELLTTLLGMDGLGKAAHIQELINQHKQLTDEQANFFVQFMSNARQHGANLQQLAGQLTSLVNVTLTVESRLKVAESALKILEQNNKNAGANLPIGS